MNKFLFNDGIIREAASLEELESLIGSSQEPNRIRIWVYHSNEWITLVQFRKQFPPQIKKQKQVTVPQTLKKDQVKKMHWSKKLLYATASAAILFLVFNFTRIKWDPATPLTAAASRPVNVPPMDIDSLITEIEFERGQSLDRSTRNNLRLRNTWPDRILLAVSAEKETSTAGSRFFNLDISIDNTTGLAIDEAVVRLLVWKNNKSAVKDTFHFKNIRFDKLVTMQTDQKIKADSLSVEFQSIRAKAFNFSYSASTKNKPGEFNDRWFSRN